MSKKVLTGIMCVTAGVATFGIYTNESTEINDYLDNHEDDSIFIKVVNAIGITFKYTAAAWGTIRLLSFILNTETDSEK